MAIEVEVYFQRKFVVPAGLDTAWALVADVPRSAAQIPELTVCEPLPANSATTPFYVFRYKTVGFQRWSAEPWHNLQFRLDRAKWRIEWRTISGQGNIDQNGLWLLAGDDQSTELDLQVQATLQLPLPALIRNAVVPIAKHQFATRMEQYTHNIAALLQA